MVDLRESKEDENRAEEDDGQDDPSTPVTERVIPASTSSAIAGVSTIAAVVSSISRTKSVEHLACEPVPTQAADGAIIMCPRDRVRERLTTVWGGSTFRDSGVVEDDECCTA